MDKYLRFSPSFYFYVSGLAEGNTGDRMEDKMGG